MPTMRQVRDQPKRGWNVGERHPYFDLNPLICGVLVAPDVVCIKDRWHDDPHGQPTTE
jgi:hypothetical protein